MRLGSWVAIALQLVAARALAEPIVLLVAEPGASLDAQSAVLAGLKSKGVSTRAAPESAAACLARAGAEKITCLAEPARAESADAVLLLSATPLQGKVAVSLQLFTLSGELLEQEAAKGAANALGKVLAPALKAIAASAKAQAAKNPKTKPAAPPPEPAPAPVAAAEPAPAPAAAVEAAPSGAKSGGKVRVAAPGLTAINLDPKLVEFYAQHLAQRLQFAGVQVITAKEIGTVLGLERQRQLLGCSESSCMTELAGALGADGILTGELAKVADTYQLNLKVISAVDAQTLATYSVHTDEEETLLKQVNLAAKEMARELYPRLGRGPAPDPVSAEVEASTGKVRRLSFLPTLFGAVFAVTGSVLLILADQQARVLHPSTGTVPLTTAQAAAAQGTTYQTLALAGFGLAGACVVAAGAMFLFGGPKGDVQTALLLSESGATFALGGHF